MDNELFELCKEVYNRTAWYGTALLITESGPTMVGPMDKDSSVPLYTSDFLLEKLPTSIPRLKEGVSRDIIMDTGYVKGEFVWRFRYDNGFEMDGTIEAFADTPLKALLKLVIALDDAGVKL